MTRRAIGSKDITLTLLVRFLERGHHLPPLQLELKNIIQGEAKRERAFPRATSLSGTRRP